jgi:hypothetical protein
MQARTFAVSLVLLLVVSLSAIAQADDEFAVERCTAHNLRGPYALVTSGSIVSAGPVGQVAEVGVITFDGQGHVSQTTTLSLNGTIVPSRTASGAYVVNQDCTGELAVTLPPPAGLSTSKFVIVRRGESLDLINTGTGRVLLGHAVRQ